MLGQGEGDRCQDEGLDDKKAHAKEDSCDFQFIIFISCFAHYN